MLRQTHSRLTRRTSASMYWSTGTSLNTRHRPGLSSVRTGARCSSGVMSNDERATDHARMSKPFLPGRWRELAPLLDEALACEAHERPAFLNRACAGDSGLRAELEALLA